MTTIKPVSDLRDYNKVLKECANGAPVILTKNGRGVFVVISIDEYKEMLKMCTTAQTGGAARLMKCKSGVFCSKSVGDNNLAVLRSIVKYRNNTHCDV